MPVLKSTYDAMLTKYEAEASRLVKRIEALSEERNMAAEACTQWRKDYEFLDGHTTKLVRKMAEARDALNADAELIDELERRRAAAAQVCDLYARHAGHQHAELERMTHERDEAVACMNVYGLTIEDLLTEIDDLQDVVADLTREVAETPEPSTLLEAVASFVCDVIGTVTLPDDFDQAA